MPFAKIGNPLIFPTMYIVKAKNPPRKPIRINVAVTNSGCIPMIKEQSNFTSPAPITLRYQSIKNTTKQRTAMGNDDIK